MNAKSLLTVALAVTVLVGGVAAAGTATPAGQAADTPDEANNSSTAAHGGSDAANASAASDAGENGNSEAGNASASERADDAGPPSDLPTQVPGRVSDVHEQIHAFLDGDVDNLGTELGGLLSENAAEA